MVLILIVNGFYQFLSIACFSSFFNARHNLTCFTKITILPNLEQAEVGKGTTLQSHCCNRKEGSTQESPKIEFKEADKSTTN